MRVKEYVKKSCPETWLQCPSIPEVIGSFPQSKKPTTPPQPWNLEWGAALCCMVFRSIHASGRLDCVFKSKNSCSHCRCVASQVLKFTRDTVPKQHFASRGLIQLPLFFFGWPQTCNWCNDCRTIEVGMAWYGDGSILTEPSGEWTAVKHGDFDQDHPDVGRWDEGCLGLVFQAGFPGLHCQRRSCLTNSHEKTACRQAIRQTARFDSSDSSVFGWGCCYHSIALQQQIPPNQQFSIVLWKSPGRQELAWEMLCEWLSVPQGSEPKAWLETAIDPLVIGDIGVE